MHSIDYVAPRSLDEALTQLAEAGAEARVLAGGTDLIVQMQEGRRRPRLIVDIKGVPELTGVSDDGAVLRLGAAVPLSSVLAFPGLAANYPMLAQACSLIGATQIQNRASIGGNLCNAAPSADSAPPLICLAARCVVASKARGQREVAVEDFFAGPGQTVIAPDELLVEIRVPRPPLRSGGSYLRHTPRAEMDIAVVAVGSFLMLSSDGTCREARIALGAVAPTPVRAREAETLLAGRSVDDVAIDAAAAAASQVASPISDVRGSAEYRRHLVSVLTRRALRQAAAAAVAS